MLSYFLKYEHAEITGSKYRWILLGMALFFSVTVFSQQSFTRVEGMVLDSAGNALPGVNVRLTSVFDTLMVATDEGGFFIFKKVIANEFTLAFSMLGLQIYNKDFRFSTSGPKITLPPFVLYPYSTFLTTVEVTRLQPVVVMTDTVQYNFAAFNFPKNTYLESALSQLPNIQVLRDGTVLAFGKPIDKVQVNGKLFFGGDVLTATRNLYADIIKQVQVIDYYGDEASLTGIQDGKQPEKILNIVLQDNKDRLAFGQLTGGGGTKDRFVGSVGFNFFNKGQELSVVGSTNNTNTNLFSFGSPSGGDRIEDGMEIAGMTDPVDGLNQVNSIGVNFSDSIGAMNVVGKYQFVQRRNDVRSEMLLRSAFQNYFVDNLENKLSESNQQSHLLKWDLEKKWNSKSQLKITPQLSFRGDSQKISSMKSIVNRKISSEVEYESQGTIENPNVGLTAYYAHVFPKANRKLFLEMDISRSAHKTNERIGDYFVSIDSSFSDPQIDVYSLFQNSDNQQHRNLGKLRAVYVEPIGTRSLLEFAYEHEYNDIKHKRLVDDIEAGSRIDSLGFDYRYSFNSDRIGFNFQSTVASKFTYVIGLGMQPLRMRGYTADKTVRTKFTHLNFIPNANFKYKISRNSEWSFDYLGSSNQPSFYQLQPVRDLSNSQDIIIGNEKLKSEFSSTFETRFKTFNYEYGRYFDLQMSVRHIKDKIVANRRTLPNSTAIETSFTNASGYYHVKGGYSMMSPIGWDNLQVKLQGNADMINSVSFSNERKYVAQHWLYSQILQMQFAYDDILVLNWNTAYTLHSSQSALNTMNSIRAHSLLNGMAAKCYISNNFLIGVDVSYRTNTGYSDFVNANPTIFDAYMEYSILPNKRGVIRLQGADLFNQSTGISREVYDNIDLSMRTNRLGQYFLLSFNLRFSKTPSGSI